MTYVASYPLERREGVLKVKVIGGLDDRPIPWG